MSEAAAETIWTLAACYAAFGALVAIVLVAGGLNRIDPLAHAAPLRVKLLWLPSFIALWPVLVLRLIKPVRERAV